MPRDPIHGHAPVHTGDVKIWQTILTTFAEDDGSYLPDLSRMLHQAIDEIWFQHQPSTCDLAEDCYICDAIQHAKTILTAHDQLQAARHLHTPTTGVTA